MSRKRTERINKLLEDTEALEKSMLLGDDEALEFLDLLTPLLMEEGIKAFLETEFDSEDIYEGQLLAAKLIIIKLVVALLQMDKLTYSMDGREKMAALRDRALAGYKLETT